MTGDIYARDKCPICNGKMIHQPKRGGCFCKEHPDQKAKGPFRIRFGKTVDKKRKSYEEAVRLLNGLRFKTDEGSYDPLDYRSDTPHAFDKLAREYIEEREEEGLTSIRSIRRHMEVAIEYFGNTNAKYITTRDLKRYIRSLSGSSKTKSNYMGTLSTFFSRYLVEEGILRRHELPDIPKVKVDLGWRKIIDLKTQNKILDKLKADAPIRVWLAVDMLRTYLELRPGDLYRVLEKDVLTDPGALLLWNPTKTKNRRRLVWLLEEHTEIIKDLKTKEPGFPAQAFFRHTSGTLAGQAYGQSQSILYYWWRRVCKELKIEGVDLYGGTRHSSTTALALEEGELAALDATGHQTNKAFRRYCQAQNVNAKKMAGVVRRLQKGTTKGTTLAPPHSNQPKAK